MNETLLKDLQHLLYTFSIQQDGVSASAVRRAMDVIRNQEGRIGALEEAMLDACREKVLHGHTTTLLTMATRLGIPGIKELCLDADRLRDESATKTQVQYDELAAVAGELANIVDDYLEGGADLDSFTTQPVWAAPKKVDG